jgi:hypothetical protein
VASVNSLTAARAGRVETAPADFEEKLVWLCKFGQPRLGMLSKGWHAKIEMNTNTTGTSFDVSTDFQQPTPSAAVDQLIERMLTALATLTGATP